MNGKKKFQNLFIILVRNLTEYKLIYYY